MSTGYWSLVEPLWDDISIYDAPDVFLRQYAEAPERARLLFAAHWAQSEFMNGGLGQFFSNPTGVLAPEAVEAFRAMGMRHCADLLAEAMAFFGDPYPRDRQTREAILERYLEEQGGDAIPLLEQENAMAVHIEEEAGGFDDAADRYAAGG
ncbi:DMP19 family protein [Luteolibacter flavescens]|uniref:DMP19 family protein n=1 Tax=Luteolibacter flavescens TaxID=1859460 RepID=A0ABT3FR53_9BACT|nr:DMP19 family protein [Luteolibacter flavescens]MCW1885445.1 DMP19 family protein [Luteolibacter flavescens]